MIPPLPDSLGGSEHERFQRFAKAVLSVPKIEITPPEEVIAKLQAEKHKVDAKIAEVRQEITKRKATPPKRSSHS